MRSQLEVELNAEEATVETIQEDLQQRTAISPPGVPGGTFEAKEIKSNGSVASHTIQSGTN
jgi:hypothetical protein